jgi:hypothetical protein
MLLDPLHLRRKSKQEARDSELLESYISGITVSNTTFPKHDPHIIGYLFCQFIPAWSY